MAEEAVVRIVLQDGTSAQTAPVTSSSSMTSAGMSTQSSAMTTLGGNDRLYREMTRNTTDLLQGFKRHLDPLLTELISIKKMLVDQLGVMTDDYNIYRDQSYTLTVGAFFRGTKALGDEITRALGVTSPERIQIDAQRQVVASNADVVRAIETLDKNLNPEKIVKQRSALSDMVIGTGIVAGMIELKELGKTMAPAISGAEAAIPAAPSIAAMGAGAAGAMDVVSKVADAIPPEILAPILVGSIGGLLLDYFSPKGETKEKSTNELLADIVNSTKSIAESSTETSRDTTSISVLMRQLVDLNTPVAQAARPIDPMQSLSAPIVPDTTEPLAARAARRRHTAAGGMNQSGRHEPADQKRARHLEEWRELQLKGGYGGEVPADFLPHQGSGPAWPGTTSQEGPAPIVFEEPDTPDPHATGPHEPPDEWDTWRAAPGAYSPAAFFNPFQKEYIEKSGFTGYSNNQLKKDEYIAFVDYLMSEGKARGLKPPVGLFARGGAVGSDTIPAMLSPGEVVVPKHMVDGGAVDHLRGKLPGFALGGMVEAGGKMLMNQMNTDPGDRIGGFGRGISALGEKLGTALPIVGGFVTALGKGTEAVSMLMGEINKSVNQYAEYSPAIAQAQAVAEIRQTMGDFRRAQAVGGDMAKFVLQQSELQQKFEEIKIKLLMELVPIVTTILEGVEGGMNEINSIAAALNQLLQPLTSISVTAERLRGELNNRIEEVEDPATQLLNRNFDPGGDWVPLR